jgi:hypothetical protein
MTADVRDLQLNVRAGLLQEMPAPAFSAEDAPAGATGVVRSQVEGVPGDGPG